jgi:hypothetical protein
VGQGLSQRKASLRYNVPRSTLQLRLKQHGAEGLLADGDGKPEPARKPGRPPKLPLAVEAAISGVFTTAAEHGLPLLRSQLPLVAAKLAPEFGIQDFVATKRWQFKFLKRHPELASRVPNPMSDLRYESTNPAAARKWIEFVRSVYVKVFGSLDAVDPKRIFNLDESPLSPLYDNKHSAAAVLASSSGKAPRVASAADRDFSTLVLTVNAAGTYALPCFILKGKILTTSACHHIESDAAAVATNESGSMDEDLFIGLLELLQPHMNASPANKVILFLDNHASHVTYKVGERAFQLGIELLALPSNTTSAFQPLDVGVFGPIKNKLAAKKAAFLSNSHGIGLSKQVLVGLAVSAIEDVCSAAVIKRAFELTGLYPLSIPALLSSLPIEKGKSAASDVVEPLAAAGDAAADAGSAAGAAVDVDAENSALGQEVELAVAEALASLGHSDDSDAAEADSASPARAGVPAESFASPPRIQRIHDTRTPDSVRLLSRLVCTVSTPIRRRLVNDIIIVGTKHWGTKHMCDDVHEAIKVSLTNHYVVPLRAQVLSEREALQKKKQDGKSNSVRLKSQGRWLTTEEARAAAKEAADARVQAEIDRMERKRLRVENSQRRKEEAAEAKKQRAILNERRAATREEQRQEKLQRRAERERRAAERKADKERRLSLKTMNKKKEKVKSTVMVLPGKPLKAMSKSLKKAAASRKRERDASTVNVYKREYAQKRSRL